MVHTHCAVLPLGGVILMLCAWIFLQAWLRVRERVSNLIEFSLLHLPFLLRGRRGGLGARGLGGGKPELTVAELQTRVPTLGSYFFDVVPHMFLNRTFSMVKLDLG